MKYFKTFSVLLMLCFLSTACFADQSNNTQRSLKTYYNNSDPSSVAAQANKMPAIQGSGFSQAFQDPMMNSMVNGYANMLQGATGGSYSQVEMQRQQAEYAKQNTQKDSDE